MKLDVRLLGVVLGIGGIVSIAHASLPASTPALVFVQPSSEPSASATNLRPIATAGHPPLSATRHRKTGHHHARRSLTHHAKKTHHHRQRRKQSAHPRHPRKRRSDYRNVPPAPLQRQEPLNINRATLSELERLPGIDPGLAHNIVIVRDAGGGFDEADDLLDVEGMTPAKLNRLEPLLSPMVNLQQVLL